LLSEINKKSARVHAGHHASPHAITLYTYPCT
jgi:hypothetical protein